MESKVASSSLGLAVGAVAPNADRAMAIGGPEPWRKKGVFCKYMGVSLDGGTPKWMVKIMENPMKMGWFGGTIILGNGAYHHFFPKTHGKNDVFLFLP